MFPQVLLLLPLLPLAQSEPAACHLPSGAAARCVDISKCRHLSKLVSNLQRPFPGDVTLLIRDSFLCEATASTITVCCPLEGIQPPLQLSTRQDTQKRPGCGMQAGAEAECVTYSECSPFVQMMVNLKKPLDPVVPDMVRSSWLCGVVEGAEGGQVPQICCPSAALAVSQQSRYLAHPGMAQLAPAENCGKATIDGRIVGGEDAAPGQFPWLVNLGYQASGSDEVLFKCGGTLIGPRHVVTAAHCVTQLPRGFDLTTVRVGEHDLDSEVDCNGCDPPQDIDIEKMTFHPSYGKPQAFQNDIALIQLKRAVTENDGVHPICLPLQDDDDNYIDVGRSGAGAAQTFTEVAGWGATTITGRKPAKVLQRLAVNVTDPVSCKKVYAERGGILGEAQICAGGEKGKVGRN